MVHSGAMIFIVFNNIFGLTRKSILRIIFVHHYENNLESRDFLKSKLVYFKQIMKKFL